MWILKVTDFKGRYPFFEILKSFENDFVFLGGESVLKNVVWNIIISGICEFPKLRKNAFVA